jgi:CheY-like chemotaxis protein
VISDDNGSSRASFRRAVGEHAVRQPGFRTKRILVVDDDPDILDALSEILEVEGYQVQRARNGREALQRMNEGASVPDLILLDLMMPVMDGWEFARTLRPGARPPIVVLSADRNVSAKAQEIGAIGWLAKPFELGELLSLVRRSAPLN